MDLLFLTDVHSQTMLSTYHLNLAFNKEHWTHENLYTYCASNYDINSA